MATSAADGVAAAGGAAAASAPDAGGEVLSVRDPIAREGDFVVLWGSYTQVFSVVLQCGQITNNKFGNFHHDEIIGKRYGSKVTSKKGGAWLALLRPTPELLTQSLTHRTQIIYHADISMLLMLLDARPGRVICEAGTGSGSVSSSFARALRPNGKLHTFEFHEDRQRQAAADFVRYGFDDVIVSRHGDVCKDGFGSHLDGTVHGIFLDLPMPWVAIQHADKALVDGGKICTFSPCIEQIDKTAAELRRDSRYHDIRMFETLAVNWGVKSESSKAEARAKDSRPKKRQRLAAPKPGDAAGPAGAGDAASEPSWLSYQMPMRSHTGFLLIATKALCDEPR